MTVAEANEPLLDPELLAERLIGPSQALVVRLTDILRDVRYGGLEDAAQDLELVLEAANRLAFFIEELSGGKFSDAPDMSTSRRLRHDLRTPISAIHGFSELVLEDFEEDLPDTAASDIASVLDTAEQILVEIDRPES